MKLEKARKFVREYGAKQELTPEEEFVYVESLELLTDDTHETGYMVELGSYYYDRKDYALALKYYGMADGYGDKWAAEGIGNIYYHGMEDVPDYEKAFKFYSKAADNGSLLSLIKVADMYKNGFYVEENYDRYCEIIETINRKTDSADYLEELMPEICSRLASIRKQQNKTDEAIELYLKARHFLAQRIRFAQFSADLNMMRELIEDLYAMVSINDNSWDLYDLYYVLREPSQVSFRYLEESYDVESRMADGDIVVSFNNVCFKNIDEFFRKAQINGEKLTVLYKDLHDFSKN